MPNYILLFVVLNQILSSAFCQSRAHVPHGCHASNYMPILFCANVIWKLCRKLVVIFSIVQNQMKKFSSLLKSRSTSAHSLSYSWEVWRCSLSERTQSKISRVMKKATKTMLCSWKIMSLLEPKLWNLYTTIWEKISELRSPKKSKRFLKCSWKYVFSHVAYSLISTYFEAYDLFVDSLSHTNK